MEMCVPFLKAGLESNEVCVWVIAEPLTEKDAWAALGEAVPALASAVRILEIEQRTPEHEARA